MDPRRQDSRSRVLDVIRTFPRAVTVDEIVEDTGLSESTVYRRLDELSEEGEIESEKRPQFGRGRNPTYYDTPD